MAVSLSTKPTLKKILRNRIRMLQRIDVSSDVNNFTLLKLITTIESIAIIRNPTTEKEEQKELRDRLLKKLGIKYPSIVMAGFRDSIAHFGYIRSIEFKYSSKNYYISWAIGHSNWKHYFGKNLIIIDLQKLKSDLIDLIQKDISDITDDVEFTKFNIQVDMTKGNKLVNELKQLINEK